MKLLIQVTMQLAAGPEVTVFRDEVPPERACPTLAVADNSVRSMVRLLQVSGIVRDYIGSQVIRSVECTPAECA